MFGNSDFASILVVRFWSSLRHCRFGYFPWIFLITSKMVHSREFWDILKWQYFTAVGRGNWGKSAHGAQRDPSL